MWLVAGRAEEESVEERREDGGTKALALEKMHLILYVTCMYVCMYVS